MREPSLLSELISVAADRDATSSALTYGNASWNYGNLYDTIASFASGLLSLGLQRCDRVAIYLEKCFETVIAGFGTTAAGCVYVPLNPLLKPAQISHILCDCNVRVLVTSPEWLALVSDALKGCLDLRHVIVLDFPNNALPHGGRIRYSKWNDLLA